MKTDRQVRRGRFRSCDKDGGHTIGPPYRKKPCYTWTSWLYLL